MGNAWKPGLALAGALACAASSVAAAGLTVGPPVDVAPGWTRIAGRYTGLDDVAGEPVFRAVARCAGRAAVQALDGVVQHVAGAERVVWLDVPTARLPRATPACGAPELAVEMRVGAHAVAIAPVPPPVAAERPVRVVAVPPARRSSRALRLKGDKYGSPLFGKRTEAGVEWALDSRVSIQLNYERTTQAPMMSFDHDDGILTRVRIAF
jgi:hypothetical protein